MNAYEQNPSIEQFPHFKNEWRPQGAYYQHRFSTDLCQLKILHGVSMKHLDLYSSREAYSFPFCPRVYKYVIEGNQVNEGGIGFDIKVLVQYVPKVLVINEQCTSNIINILKAFQYLFMRFGAFRIKKRMISKTQLGLVKAWINQDYSSNCVQEQASTQAQMINDFYALLGNSALGISLRSKHLSSLRAIISYLQQKRVNNSQQKQALKQIQNYQLTHDKSQSILTHDQQKSRKNITFSYSNKDIVKESAPRRQGKRNSILLDNQNNGFLPLAKLISPVKEAKFPSNVQQAYSMKFINQAKYKNRKKISPFNPIHATISKETRFKINNFSYYEAIHSNSGKQKETSSVKSKEANLFHSASINPYKFINQRGQNTQWQQSIKSSCGGKQEVQKIEALKTQVNSLLHGEARCDELRNDLQALFKSENEFDYGQLMGELDSIL